VKYTDEKIIKGIIEGGTQREKAFSYLYKKLRKKVISKIRILGGSTDDAHDVLQIAITSFWEKVHTGDFVLTKNTNIKGLIIRISERRWIDNIRKKHFEKKISIDENILKEKETTNYDKEFDKIININLDKLLKQLSEKCRKIIIYYYLNARSMKEIADLLGYSDHNSAKTQKYKCMKHLLEYGKKPENEYLKII